MQEYPVTMAFKVNGVEYSVRVWVLARSIENAVERFAGALTRAIGSSAPDVFRR